MPEAPQEFRVRTMDPADAKAGSGPVTLNVIGAGFTVDSVITLDGEDAQTVFINANTLRTELDLTEAESGPIAVVVRQADGKESAALQFRVTEKAG
jgi:hypothetical protein